MTTIMVDDDVKWVQLPPTPGFVPRTIPELLAEGFEFRDERFWFYDCQGKAILVFPDMDYAENWSVHPIREVHPFHPICHGKQISEEEFRALVKRIHGLD